MSSFASLVGALWYLRVTSIVGRVRSRLRRLKQPKYLAGALVGAVYFYLVFFRRAHRPQFGGHPGAPASPAEALPADLLPLFGEIGALALLVVLAINWLVPRHAALAFSESEIAFLFPAPVSRRMLVHYRLLSAQLGIAFTALIFTVVFGRGGGFGDHTWYRFIGWWLILAMVNLHFTGTSFVYSRLLNRSITTARRRAITLSVAAAVLLALIAWIAFAARLPTAADFSSAANAADYAREMLHVGPMPWLLALPKLAVAPYFAMRAGEFALAMLPALALLAAHYFWVVHTEVSFEEASIARAEKRAARRRAIQQGDWRGNAGAIKAGAPPFVLTGSGRSEPAFLWKNLIAAGALFRPKPMLSLAVLLGAGAWWISRQPDLQAVSAALSVVGLIVLVLAVLFGPQLVRQDLRTDLANADILKTYPLRGWQIVLGEMLTPVAILTVVSWLALLTIWLALPDMAMSRIPPGLRGEAALGLALLAPPFIAIQVFMPNAATVLFPAWVQATGDRTERGIEVMGQRLIFVVSQFLVTALALLPALLVGGLVLFIVNLIAGIAIGGAAAVVAMAALLGFEAWLGIRWLGNRFEALDISSELRA
ncbi:MAG TPA: putative ABC exporter domain-containing protein [Steroidobacteraceae bacterium]|nr:putative ABC exporter domain-containing protein [Steroidobacteraceae bacterium]